MDLMRFVNFIIDTVENLESFESIEDVTVKENGDILLHITDDCGKERIVVFK